MITPETWTNDVEQRFQAFVDDLGSVLANATRGLDDYLTGLVMPGKPKSMEAMAAVLEPGHVPRRRDVAYR
jgi:SRSO17 transposase